MRSMKFIYLLQGGKAVYSQGISLYCPTVQEYLMIRKYTYYYIINASIFSTNYFEANK